MLCCVSFRLSLKLKQEWLRLTFGGLKVRLLDKSWHSARKLEDNSHGFAATDNNLSAFWLLGLLALATASSLVVQLFFACANLRLCSELVEQSNSGFVVVCTDTWLR